MKAQALADYLQSRYAEYLHSVAVHNAEVTLEVIPSHLKSLCRSLRMDADLAFEQLIDLCGVDYLHYGLSEWVTDEATGSGFERGVMPLPMQEKLTSSSERFAVVYHLLSVSHNHRLRLRVRLSEDLPLIDSVIDIWASANWYEREAFDLFGILFQGHPDLRRILTDYGFVGHPFRKDFPLIGEVEMRFDAKLGRVVYEPVSIQPRVLVPKVIRDDHRYEGEQHG